MFGFIKKRWLWIILLFLLLASGCFIVYHFKFRKPTPTITGTPTERPQEQNEQLGTFVLPVYINSEDYAISALQVYLTFDPNELQVLSVAKENSFILYWVTDRPSYSNQDGRIIFAGGIPTPGFKGRGLVGSVTYRKLVDRTVYLSFDPATKALEDSDAGKPIPLTLSAMPL